MTRCNHCQGTGHLNTEQLPAGIDAEDAVAVAKWARENTGHDVEPCDCCGDGDDWYGAPGWHYGPDDPPGHGGPYAYNGGLCECH